MNIGAWGDSLVYGSCDNAGLGWIGRIRKDYAPETDEHAVMNYGVQGDTSRGLLKRFKQEFESLIFKPKIVLFAVALNDSVTRRGSDVSDVPSEEYRDNMRAVIQQAKEFSVRILIVGPTNVDESRTNPFPGSSTGKRFNNEGVAKYNEALKQISEEESVEFINVFGTLENNELADGLHPTESGYEKMYQIISSYLK